MQCWQILLDLDTFETIQDGTAYNMSEAAKDLQQDEYVAIAQMRAHQEIVQAGAVENRVEMAIVGEVDEEELSAQANIEAEIVEIAQVVSVASSAVEDAVEAAPPTPRVTKEAPVDGPAKPVEGGMFKPVHTGHGVGGYTDSFELQRQANAAELFDMVPEEQANPARPQMYDTARLEDKIGSGKLTRQQQGHAQVVTDETLAVAVEKDRENVLRIHDEHFGGAAAADENIHRDDGAFRARSTIVVPRQMAEKQARGGAEKRGETVQVDVESVGEGETKKKRKKRRVNLRKRSTSPASERRFGAGSMSAVELRQRAFVENERVVEAEQRRDAQVAAEKERLRKRSQVRARAQLDKDQTQSVKWVTDRPNWQSAAAARVQQGPAILTHGIEQERVTYCLPRHRAARHRAAIDASAAKDAWAASPASRPPSSSALSMGSTSVGEFDKTVSKYVYTHARHGIHSPTTPTNARHGAHSPATPPPRTPPLMTPPPVTPANAKVHFGTPHPAGRYAATPGIVRGGDWEVEEDDDSSVSLNASAHEMRAHETLNLRGTSRGSGGERSGSADMYSTPVECAEFDIHRRRRRQRPSPIATSLDFLPLALSPCKNVLVHVRMRVLVHVRMRVCCVHALRGRYEASWMPEP